MTTLPKTLMKVTCLSIALLGATAVVATMTLPDAAYAKSDKAKGKSKDKSNKGKSKERSKPAKPAKPVKAAATGGGCGSGSYNGGGVASEIGVHPCQLGNLNAWNNNSGNTNPNSMPGKLAAFEGMVAENIIFKDAISSAKANVEGATLPADLTGYTSTTTCSMDGYCTYDVTGLPTDPTDPAYDPNVEQLVAYNGYVDALIAAEDNFAANGHDTAAELDAIANKDMDDATRQLIEDWIAKNLADAAAADADAGTDAGADS